ncbi:MAG: hypothetical protein QM493_07585 [Sulfurovum sp.]
MALVSYLNITHYLSYNRVVSALQTLYDISLSEGTVRNILKRTSDLSLPEIEKITQ